MHSGIEGFSDGVYDGAFQSRGELAVPVPRRIGGHAIIKKHIAKGLKRIA